MAAAFEGPEGDVKVQEGADDLAAATGIGLMLQ